MDFEREQIQIHESDLPKMFMLLNIHVVYHYNAEVVCNNWKFMELDLLIFWANPPSIGVQVTYGSEKSILNAN